MNSNSFAKIVSRSFSCARKATARTKLQARIGDLHSTDKVVAENQRKIIREGNTFVLEDVMVGRIRKLRLNFQGFEKRDVIWELDGTDFHVFGESPHQPNTKTNVRWIWKQVHDGVTRNNVHYKFKRSGLVDVTINPDEVVMTADELMEEEEVTGDVVTKEEHVTDEVVTKEEPVKEEHVTDEVVTKEEPVKEEVVEQQVVEGVVRGRRRK